jgi:hypothetical protein
MQKKINPANLLKTGGKIIVPIAILLAYIIIAVLF